MTTITDEFMRERLAAARTYCFVILREGPNSNQAGVEQIVWEHGRRNFALREDGLLPIVCPVGDDSGISGFGIFNTSLEEARKIMDEDPGVKAGVFVYELHVCRGFPTSSLPAE